MAPDYDREISMDETLMGLGLVRWWVCRGLTGKVLEVSCGTGRNLKYYGSQANVVATDLSDKMLAEAAAKVRVIHHPTHSDDSAHTCAVRACSANERMCVCVCVCVCPRAP
jgi:SAM-dependent methyltransferase